MAWYVVRCCGYGGGSEVMFWACSQEIGLAWSGSFVKMGVGEATEVAVMRRGILGVMESTRLCGLDWAEWSMSAGGMTGMNLKLVVK